MGETEGGGGIFENFVEGSGKGCEKKTVSHQGSECFPWGEWWPRLKASSLLPGKERKRKMTAIHFFLLNFFLREKKALLCILLVVILEMAKVRKFPSFSILDGLGGGTVDSLLFEKCTLGWCNTGGGRNFSSFVAET